MNGHRFRVGDWVQTTLVPEAVRVLARSVHSDKYECGFMDGREFSMPLGNREFRINNRPRVRVHSTEILGVVEMPVRHTTATEGAMVLILCRPLPNGQQRVSRVMSDRVGRVEGTFGDLTL